MNKLDEANILFWDMETLPYLSFHWGMWKQNINAQQIVKDVSMICISYKWLNSKRVHTISIGDDLQTFRRDPYAGGIAVAEAFIPVINAADFAVAHNGDKFDYRILKAAGVMGNLPSFRVRKVDTLKMAKAAGMFPEGNKLDNLAKVLGIEQKYSTNMKMWTDIALDANTQQLAKMEEYCEQDVRVLENVFLRLWPHTESMLPNISTLTGGDINGVECDKCGSGNWIKNGKYIKNVLIYQRYICKTCGSTFIGRRALKVDDDG